MSQNNLQQNKCCTRCRALDQIDQNPTEEICINHDCPCHAPQDTDKGWEVEFRERFTYLAEFIAPESRSDMLVPEKATKLKEWIRAEIKRAEERERERILGILDELKELNRENKEIMVVEMLRELEYLIKP